MTQKSIDNELEILRELSEFSKRRDKSGRYKLGRIIRKSDIPYLNKLNSMGYINLGFDYKLRESTISITKKGEALIS